MLLTAINMIHSMKQYMILEIQLLDWTLGGIKYNKSTVRNQSIIQKSFSSLLHPQMVLDEQPTGFKNGGFVKTSQLHKCGFAYI
jgi:hypothetical protein